MKKSHMQILIGVAAAVVVTRGLVRGGLGGSAQSWYANLPTLEVN